LQEADGDENSKNAVYKRPIPNTKNAKSKLIKEKKKAKQLDPEKDRDAIQRRKDRCLYNQLLYF
jgi:hypothetical protein